MAFDAVTAQDRRDVFIELCRIGERGRDQPRGEEEELVGANAAGAEATALAIVTPSFNNSHACDDSRDEGFGVADSLAEGGNDRAVIDRLPNVDTGEGEVATSSRESPDS
jgi:hypothetical protein